MSNVNKVKLLLEHTSEAPPVIFFIMIMILMCSMLTEMMLACSAFAVGKKHEGTSPIPLVILQHINAAHHF